jgi:hypothetical protein
VPVPKVGWSGTWWLPEHPDRQIRGTAHFGATQTLDVSMQLEPPVPPEQQSTGITINSLLVESREYPVVFGEVEGIGAVTLAEVSGMYWDAPFPANHSCHFRYAIEGARVPAAGLMFDRFLFSTDRLWEWCTPAAIELVGAVDDPTVHLPAQSLLDGTYDSANIRLASRPTFHISSPRMDGELIAVWEIKLESPIGLLTGIHQWIGPLRDLISFLSSRPNRITWIMVGFPGEERQFEVHMWLLGDDLPSNDSSLRPDEQLVPFRALEEPCRAVTSWLDGRESFMVIRARLLSMGYAPLLFEEQRVTNLAQAAESLHRLLWDHPSRPVKEHRARVDAVVAAAPAEHQEWARRVLSNANQLSLRVRVQEIVDQAVRAGMPLGPDDPTVFAKEVSDARNRPSHGGSLLEGGNLDHLYRVFQGLDWMLKGILLSQLGISTVTVANRLNHNSEFVYQAAQLGWRAIASTEPRD